MRAHGPEITKDRGAHMTCHHYPGIIRVTSHRMKVLERVGISYVSNKLYWDYLRSVVLGAVKDQAGVAMTRMGSAVSCRMMGAMIRGQWDNVYGNKDIQGQWPDK